jgi:hypothetical protein
MSMIPPIRCIGPETLDAQQSATRARSAPIWPNGRRHITGLAGRFRDLRHGLARPYRGAAQCSARDDCGRGIKISAVLTHFATMCVLYFRQLGAIVPPLISSVIS